MSASEQKPNVPFHTCSTQTAICICCVVVPEGYYNKCVYAVQRTDDNLFLPLPHGLFAGSDPEQGQEPSRLGADGDTQSCEKVHEGRSTAHPGLASMKVRIFDVEPEECVLRKDKIL